MIHVRDMVDCGVRFCLEGLLERRRTFGLCVVGFG